MLEFNQQLYNKRLLILGGSRISCEIVNAAKAMGIYTVVTDWYPESESPAKLIADKSFMVSTADIDALIKLIEEEEIDGVLTGFTDSTLPYYARLCERAGLPCYGTEKQFDIFINKSKFKQICSDFQLPVVEEYKLSLDATPEQVSKLNFPVLIKPSDNSGARGVSIVQNEQEFESAYIKALSYSPSKTIITERYVTGKEATVFYLIKDGEVYLTAIGNRHVKHHQKGSIPLPVAYTFPSKYLETYNKSVNDSVIQMFNSLEMKNGMVFIQTLIEGDRFYFYDIGYRLTGSLEYKLLEKICGINPLKMMIEFALTGSMGTESINKCIQPYFNQYACNITFLVRPGVIGEIVGLDEILLMPGVIDAVPALISGEEVKVTSVGTLLQIVLRVFAVANTIDQLIDVIKKVQEKYKVFSIEGDNMLLEYLDAEEVRHEFAE